MQGRRGSQYKGYQEEQSKADYKDQQQEGQDDLNQEDKG